MQNIVKEINPNEGGQSAVQGINSILRADQPHFEKHGSMPTQIPRVRYVPQAVPLSLGRRIDGGPYPPATYAPRNVQILPPPRVISEPLQQVHSVRISYVPGHPATMSAQPVQYTGYPIIGNPAGIYSIPGGAAYPIGVSNAL